MDDRATRFFLWCSGAHFDLLKRCPTEHAKYTGLGTAVFFTGLFASLASGYAFYTVFDSVVYAAILGLLWGLMIFNLDRYIISSMRKENSFRKELLIALPRIVLAVMISIVISKPLELKIFEKEIMPELIVMQQKAFAMQEQEVRNRFSTMNSLLRNDLEVITKDLGEKRAKRDQLQKAAQEEADGTGGSKKRNLGPIYKLKKEDAEKADQEFQQMLLSQMPNMKRIEDKLQQHDSLLQSAIGGLQLSERNGPAARMEALDKITTESKPVLWASWFILLLIIAVETMPVFIKLMSNKGPYDNLLKIEEFSFETSLIEETGNSSATVRNLVQQWPDKEKGFANERLDSLLKKF